MLKIENVEVMGWEHAIRGMRNPMNSWEKSDSGTCMGTLACHSCEKNRTTECNVTVKPGDFIVGPNDQKLMGTLRNAGTDHRKFMRMITVYLDITAPLYWWKEFDTYKVGTVANSCSTMHKIHAKEFTLDDFSHEHVLRDNSVTVNYVENDFRILNNIQWLMLTIDLLNAMREAYLETKDKQYWWQLIQLLPSSYNQKRTVMLNYEVLANIYKSRKNHKLDEWHEFCCWIIHSLPYSSLITCDDWLYLAFEEAKKIDPRIAKVEMKEDPELNHVNFIFRDKDGYILYIPNIPNGQDDPIEYLKSSVKECVEFQTIDKGEWHEV